RTLPVLPPQRFPLHHPPGNHIHPNPLHSLHQDLVLPVPFSFRSASSSHRPHHRQSAPVTAVPQAGESQIFSFQFPCSYPPSLSFLPPSQVFQELESPLAHLASDTALPPLHPSATADPPRPPGSGSVPSLFPHRPGR